MHVSVTRADIAAAKIVMPMSERPYEQSCPVALALHRQFGVTADVCTDSIRFGKTMEVKLPRTVARRIERYDGTGEMVPFSFDLDMVLPTAVEGA